MRDDRAMGELHVAYTQYDSSNVLSLYLYCHVSLIALSYLLLQNGHNLTNL